MTAIHYLRSGGFKPPRDDESLDIEADGAFNLWRSVGWTASPYTPVGRFGGVIDPDLNALLHDEAGLAAAAGALMIPIVPDSPVESILAYSVRAVMGIHTDPARRLDQPAGVAWAPLVLHLRRLLVELTHSPISALGLTVTPDGRAARLTHFGRVPLQIDLSALAIHATLFEGQLSSNHWGAPHDILGLPERLTVSGGMSFELPFNHGFELTYRHRVTAQVDLAIYDGTVRRPVSLYGP